ncbi:hypothetical protein C1645_840095 [Glomus cerebriforme]|uniref:Myb/SANT-like DNA-binding domain-containing protein n=1 Tax=Glomus cerebriforme TaxID=658196 RepID=A0A397S4P7_9GLOM|nr:hypothetical protein C1645_840095 [Glomus cerebriforme]
MAEWTDPEIRTLIDERRTRNDEFHNLVRNRERFWGSIASKINQKNGSSFNGHQCKEKFSNLVRDYNAMCNFMSGKSKARSQTGARYFDEFRTHFWERPKDEFDRVRNINTFNRRRSRGSGNITSSPSTREVERELRSSERRLSRSPSISRSQSPTIGRRSRRQSPPIKQRRFSTILPVSSLTTNDEMDISDTEQLDSHRRTSLHDELHVSSLSFRPPPSYDIATGNTQESSNVGEIKKSVAYRLINSAKVIQRTWRAFKLRPETWAKRVWNMVRNNGTPDRK